MSLPYIKVCGLTTQNAVEACSVFSCGYNGFIAYEPSPRHLTPQQMQSLGRYVAKSTKKVLVTVNAKDNYLKKYVDALLPDMLQLHGNENASRIQDIKDMFGLPVIKAIAVKDSSDLMAASSFFNVANMLLLDTKKEHGGSGGTGMCFDWSILKDFHSPLPYFLSGGICKYNVKQALELGHTPYIDISSSLEVQKGVKSTTKIKDFFAELS